MSMISSNLLKKFLVMAGDQLKGKWTIIGGASLLLQESDARVTIDIDIAGPERSMQEDTLILMKIAQTLGLPVEAVNQAGAFFLHQIKDWQKNVVEVHRGKKGVIYRPDGTLFILLKLGRLTETDLSDCLRIISLASNKNETLDWKRLKNTINPQLKTCDNTAKIKRYQTLLGKITEPR